MKLAWDMTGTEFGERLYSGDPEINAQRWFHHPIARDCAALVEGLLDTSR